MSSDGIKLNQRPIPGAALRDPDAVEMLRVWIAEQKLHCSMKVGMYHETMNIPEEVAWGTILADIAKHLANALEEKYSIRVSDSLEKMRDTFIQEINASTSVAKGGFIEKH